jgi:predicted PurR-regulated permease PerM
MIRTPTKTRRIWDSHGSWILLIIIAISCFMAGSQFNAASTSQTIKVITDSYERQENANRQRIRELNEETRQLAQQLATKADQAVQKADQAVTKATEAATKASEVVEKVQPNP